MPDRNLKVALIPLDMRLGEPEANNAIARERILGLPDDVDLVVLPELATTGFGKFPVKIDSLAEADNGSTVRAMMDISIEKDLAICGGFIKRREDGGYENRAYFIDRGEIKGFYTKRHLFAGPEKKIFTPGNELPPIIEYKSWRLRPFICYDMRFPVWMRNIKNEYDALILMANWPNSRYYAWRHLLIARAIENQVYVCACNREGEDAYGEYGRGDSMIINAMGFPVGETMEDGTEIGVMCYETFNEYRSKVQPWLDADEFNLYGI